MNILETKSTRRKLIAAGFGTAVGFCLPGCYGSRIRVGEEIVVSQSDKKEHPWGEYQFPTIARLNPDRLTLTFQRFVDSASLDSADKHLSPAVYISKDGGNTWGESREVVDSLGHRSIGYSGENLFYLKHPPVINLERDVLPPVIRCVDHGYGGCYHVRDPLEMGGVLENSGAWFFMEKELKDSLWNKRRARINDLEAGIISYDPPGENYAVMHWFRNMNTIKLSDNSFLAAFYGYRLKEKNRDIRLKKQQSWCLGSSDGGSTWNLRGIIAKDLHRKIHFGEPNIIELRDNSILAMVRTTCSNLGPLYKTISKDNGRTWEDLKEVHPFGVLPNILKLENGVNVLSFGRPGAHILFDRGGLGKRFCELTTLVQEQKIQTRTSGYTGLVATGRDKFLVVYDQFDYPNKDNQPRKTILAREIEIKN